MRPSARPLWAGKRRVTTPSSALRRGEQLPLPAQTEAQKALWDSLTFVEDPASGPVAENLFPDRPARRDDFYSELCTKRSRGKALVWTLEQGGNIVCTVGAYALCNGQAYMACGQTAEALRGQRVGGRLIVQMANALSAQGNQPVFLCSPERVHFFTHNSASTRLAPLRVTKARLERIKNFKHVNAEPFL